MNKLAYQIGVMTAKLAAGMSIDSWKPRKPGKDSASRLARLFQQQHSDTIQGPDNKTKILDDPHNKERSFWGPQGDPSGGGPLTRQSDLPYDTTMTGNIGNVF
jgi:hypothetical protein